ncbi:UvrD-helicase domain-containing protein [Pedobacter sandarakinus]|uniref:UvrD-helicase domain-containing protein n=1 Tax=Pedobacter sandarakinus TaxID=353156 RepID=UPI0022486ABA|nr:UvrD-helicase domain-containing protein [Pedobacter sandarakinus]MCX2576287.1 UvrD-helicase domain-containing protein [Pedobacter sandarakinus]
MQKPVKILQASAGSGKTFSLAAHYLTLLFSGDNKYREILAVTFTNKATEEMKTRILEVLLGFAKGDVSKKTDDYRQLVLAAHPQLNTQTLKLKADKIYRKILHDYSRFSVSTIDGFVQKVIRGFAFELGLDSGYSLEMNTEKVKNELTAKLEKLLDEKDNLLQWVVELALDRISNNKSWNYNTELLKLVGEVFKDQFKDFETAVEHFGTENTDEVFKKYIDFSKNYIKKFEADLTELAETAFGIIEVSGFGIEDFKGKSRSPLLKFNSIIYGNFNDVEKVLKLMDDEENWFPKGKSNELYQDINPILHQLSAIYNTGIADYILAKAFIKNGYFLRLMQEIAVLLAAYRDENETLLISDAQKLLNGIAEDAGENPSFIWEKMGNKYRNFLFDEFQDTSANQWNSFKALVSNAISVHDGKLHDHLIVGDAKQSIYRWRDGDYKLLHQKAMADLGEHNAFADQLEENYRSTEEVIKFNNNLYPRLAKLLQNKINGEIPADDELLNSFWNDKRNQYTDIITKIYDGVAQNKHSKTTNGGIIKIKKINFDKPKASADGLVENIASDIEPDNKKEAALNEMLKEVNLLLNEKGYQQREIGVLVRSNAEATEVVNALMAGGLDVISGEALKIASSTAIKLIVNVLKLLVVSPANSALYKANCIALYAQLHEKAINGDDYFALKETPIENLKHVLPSNFCENYRTWLGLPLSALIENIITAFGLDQYQKHNINPFLPYLLAFRDLTNKASRQGEKGISAFLNWWEEEGHNKNLPSPETANAIQVMTIHKSKGLAFRAVFIPFCDWPLGGRPNSTFWVPMDNTPYADLQSIPLQFTSQLKGSSVTKYYLEELLMNYMDALNSLYVATTRAKDYIYISFPGKKKPSLSHVGDAVFDAFAEDFENSDEIQIGTFSDKGDGVENFDTLNLAVYPTTSRLEEVYQETENRPQKYIDNITKSGIKGSNLHAILAEVNNVDEVDSALDRLVLEGLILEDERADYLQQVAAVLSHPELSALLSQNANQINEKSIIGTDGKTYRPDKLVLNGKQVSIIDYKFTAEESQNHVAQIVNYKSLIEAMGYENVKPYLFYASLKKLKAV